MWNVAKQAEYAWLDDYAPSMGAALAYYTVFSIAPLLLIVVSIAGLVFGTYVATWEMTDTAPGREGLPGEMEVLPDN